MKTNYEKVLERDVKLSELDDRAGKNFNDFDFREEKRLVFFFFLPLSH
jgi:hypothetical protein